MKLYELIIALSKSGKWPKCTTSADGNETYYSKCCKYRVKLRSGIISGKRVQQVEIDDVMSSRGVILYSQDNHVTPLREGCTYFINEYELSGDMHVLSFTANSPLFHLNVIDGNESCSTLYTEELGEDTQFQLSLTMNFKPEHYKAINHIHSVVRNSGIPTLQLSMYAAYIDEEIELPPEIWKK